MHQWCCGMFLKREITSPAGPVASGEALFVCRSLVTLPVEFYRETKIQSLFWQITVEGK